MGNQTLTVTAASTTSDPASVARFVEKWAGVELSEHAASHEHFIDLCRLVGHPPPPTADPAGEDYTFEKPVKVVGVASKGSKGEGGTGFVDVWKRGHFAWEYKRKGRYKSLDEAYRQLFQYRECRSPTTFAQPATGPWRHWTTPTTISPTQNVRGASFRQRSSATG